MLVPGTSASGAVAWRGEIRRTGTAGLVVPAGGFGQPRTGSQVAPTLVQGDYLGEYAQGSGRIRQPGDPGFDPMPQLGAVAGEVVGAFTSLEDATYMAQRHSALRGGQQMAIVSTVEENSFGQPYRVYNVVEMWVPVNGIVDDNRYDGVSIVSGITQEPEGEWQAVLTEGEHVNSVQGQQALAAAREMGFGLDATHFGSGVLSPNERNQLAARLRGEMQERMYERTRQLEFWKHEDPSRYVPGTVEQHIADLTRSISDGQQAVRWLQQFPQYWPQR